MVRMSIALIPHEVEQPVVEVVMNLYYGSNKADELLTDITVARTVAVLEQLVIAANGAFVNDEPISQKDSQAKMGVVVIVYFEEKDDLEDFRYMLEDTFE